VTAEWWAAWYTSRNRRAKYYRLTRAGKKRVEKATQEWEQTTEILARFLSPGEAQGACGCRG
jgi:DNA-binding PadR family transcriptional regulator